MPKASIIIPTYNRNKVLCNTISNAVNQDYSDYEILIVDQTEKHDRYTSQFLEDLPPAARVITQKSPSLTRARNTGIREAKGDIVIMIDDDVIIGPSFLSEHLKYYDNPSIGGVTGKITGKSKDKSYFRPLLKNDFLKWISPIAFQSIHEQEAQRFAGGNFSFRKSLLGNTGYFDTNFIGTAWAEDLDFSIRFKNSGNKIIYNPKAEIYHLALQEGGCENRKRFNTFSIFSRAYNLSYLIKKHEINFFIYFYLASYIYRLSFIKKDYLCLKGLLFIVKGHADFIKGLFKGYTRAMNKKPE